MTSSISCRAGVLAGVSLSAMSLGFAAPAAAQLTYFKPGDLVVSTVSGSVLDTASAITLNHTDLGAGGTTATMNGSLTLPQTTNGANVGISGEYGSASEGILQLSANGQYLTMMGYGVNANTFNSSPVIGTPVVATSSSTSKGVTTYTTTTTATYAYETTVATATSTVSQPAAPAPATEALGQTTSLTTGTFTTVPRVAALIGTNASVDTTTALTGVFNTNNPRSVATVDGSSFYVSGQGVTGDGTGGVFYALKGATTATPINNGTTVPSGTGNGTGSATTGIPNPLFGTETRVVEIVNTGAGNTLEVSRDVGVSGTPNDATDIRVLGTAGTLPTSAVTTATTLIAGTVSSGLNTGSIDVTNATDNGVNHARNGQAIGHTGNTFVYLSPEEFFYANADTLYVADSGSPKNGSATAAGLGEGGLQKWSLVGSTWVLDYDMVNGLSLVGQAAANAATPTAPGVTGLFGLTGEVVGGQVELFATSYGLNELSPSYLYRDHRLALEYQLHRGRRRNVHDAGGGARGDLVPRRVAGTGTGAGLDLGVRHGSSGGGLRAAPPHAGISGFGFGAGSGERGRYPAPPLNALKVINV